MYHTCFLSSQAGLSVLLGIRYRPVCCETKSVIWYMSCSGARACLFAGCDCAVQQHAQLQCCSTQRARPPRGSRTPPSTGAPISAPSRRGRTCLPRRSLRGGPWPLRGKSSRSAPLRHSASLPVGTCGEIEYHNSIGAWVNRPCRPVPRKEPADIPHTCVPHGVPAPQHTTIGIPVSHRADRRPTSLADV